MPCIEVLTAPMWNDEFLEDTELDILRPFLETEVRILDSLSEFVLACIRIEGADVRCAPGQAGRKQRVSVQQFHASFTCGLAESPIQGCQRKSRSKRQV